MQIKGEILRLLTAGTPEDFYNSVPLIRAEKTATDQIRNRIGKRYDCDAIFAPAEGELDGRDQFIVTIVIDIALYHLYSKTGARDIPKHRADRYADALDWLRDVGNGTTPTELPPVVDPDGEQYSETLISSRPPEDHKW